MTVDECIAVVGLLIIYVLIWGSTHKEKKDKKRGKMLHPD